MASRVDGMSTLFTALEPSSPTGASSAPANQSSARRDSRGFADHLQQASQPKPSSYETRATSPSGPSRGEAKSTDAHYKSRSAKPTTTTGQANPNRTQATADSEQAKSEQTTNDDAPVKDETADAVTPTGDAVTDPQDETDEENGDESIPALLQVAQVVVPEAIVAPQAELAVHTEVATAGDADSVAPASATRSTGDATQVEADGSGNKQDKSTVSDSETAGTVDRLTEQANKLIEITQTTATHNSQSVETVAAATESLQTAPTNGDATRLANVASQAQLVAATRTTDQADDSTESDKPSATDAALQNEVTQVIASTSTAAAAATSTTVVSAITSTSNFTDGSLSSDDRDRTTPEVAAVDTGPGQDKGVAADNAIPRHARLALDKLSPHTGQTVETSNLTEAERVRFVQRVANAIHNAAETGGPIRLRLTPPELGAVRIEMRILEGQMSVRMEAETPQAQAALLDNLPVLRERLEAQDIKIAKFDVDLFGGSNSNLSQSPQRDPNQDGPLPRHQLRRDGATLDVPEPTSSVSRPAVANDGGLNVLI